MTDKSAKIFVIPSGDAQLELRLFRDPASDNFLSWKMTRREAESLMVWWRREGERFTETDEPVHNLRSENVLVSMTSPTFVDVRMLTEHGTPKRQGCSLPRYVVQRLMLFLDCEQPQT